MFNEMLKQDLSKLTTVKDDKEQMLTDLYNDIATLSDYEINGDGTEVLKKVSGLVRIGHMLVVPSDSDKFMVSKHSNEKALVPKDFILSYVSQYAADKIYNKDWIKKSEYKQENKE